MFIQPDWFEVFLAGTNRYAYSFNDPANWADPGGNIPDNWATEDYPTAYDSSGWKHQYVSSTGGNISIYDSRLDRQSGQHQDNPEGFHTIAVYSGDHGQAGGIDPVFRSGVQSRLYDDQPMFRRGELDAATLAGSRNAAAARGAIGTVATVGSLAVGVGEAYGSIRLFLKFRKARALILANARHNASIAAAYYARNRVLSKVTKGSFNQVLDHMERLEKFAANPTVRDTMLWMSKEAIRAQQITRMQKLGTDIYRNATQAYVRIQSILK